MKTLFAVLIGICSLMSCQPNPPIDTRNHIQKVYGQWLQETNGTIILDPQSSGLTLWRGRLLTVSDRSAHESQRLKLRTIEPNSAELSGPDLQLKLAESAKPSCFAQYLSDNPDLEALTVDPDDDSIFYLVTEDATDAEPMSEGCQQKYQKTGSTDYPSLLFKVQMAADATALITHIRPIQFNQEMHIGDYPNDGIEALAFGKNRTLYLGIEKDQEKKARVFSLIMDDAFWQSDDFITVQNVPLKLPEFKSGNHPINGMDYYQTPDGKEYLILAARNDQALWIADLSGQKPAKIVPLEFYAEIINGTGVCKDYEIMDNSSIEGVAVQNEKLWLVNDPWKAVYLNNIRCPQNKRNYRQFSTLLFSLPIQPYWFD